jgi:hypothetical protein
VRSTESMMLSRNEGIIYKSQSLIFQQSGYRKIGKSGIGGFVGMAHGIPLHGNFQESGRWRGLNLFR